MDSVAGVFVPAEVLASEQGVPVEEVIERIRAGVLTGRQQGSTWQVLVRMPATEGPPAGGQPPAGSVTAQVTGPVTLAGRPEVVVRDVHISLGTLVGLIIKLVLALIIAGVILGGLAMAVVLLLESYGQGLVDSAMEVLGPLLPG